MAGRPDSITGGDATVGFGGATAGVDRVQALITRPTQTSQSELGLSFNPGKFIIWSKLTAYGTRVQPPSGRFR